MKAQTDNLSDDGIISGMWSMYPSWRSFRQFEQEDDEIANHATPRIMAFLKQQGVFESAERPLFEKFIRNNSSLLTPVQPAPGFNFENLLEEILGARTVKWLVEQLNRIAQDFNMPRIQESMLTRLKKDFLRNRINTAKKRSCLRILAFWIGKTQPKLGWNYDVIAGLPDLIDQRGETEAGEGARMAFHLRGQREIIVTDDLEWLETAIKSSINDLKLFHIEPVLVCDGTTLFLNIPRQKGRPAELQLYSQAICDSIGIAHQVVVRWALSANCGRSKKIVVAIAAGEFHQSDRLLYTLLEAKLSSKPAICLTDFAYLCARAADVKVVFAEKPDRVHLKNSVLPVWRIRSFWTFTYFDFVPSLQNEDMPLFNSQDHKDFQAALYFKDKIKLKRFNALAAINRFPQNSMLLLEVAKVLFYKKMFQEAYMLTSKVIPFDPHHVVARTLRMLVLLNLALKQRDASLKTRFFERALAEGQFITANGSFQHEDFFCEFGLVYFAWGVQLLIDIRADPNKASQREQVFTLLRQAEDRFEKGIIHSSTGVGHRSIFWLWHVRGLRMLLEKNRADLFNKETLLADPDDIYAAVVKEIFVLSGWIIDDPDSGKRPQELTAYQLASFLKIVDNIFKIYDNSVLLKSYSPNIKLAFATVLFDINPFLTVKTVKTAIEYLKQARFEADNLGNDEGIYSITNLFGMIHGKTHFIACIDRCLAAIEGKLGGELSTLDDEDAIPRKKLNGLKISLLNIERMDDERVLFP